MSTLCSLPLPYHHVHHANPFSVTQRVDHDPEPLIGPAIHTDLTLPLRLQKISVRFRHARLGNVTGVVTESPVVRINRRPRCLRILVSFAEVFPLGRVIGSEQPALL